MLVLHGLPFFGTVAIGDIAAGPGVHRGLVCPVCNVVNYKLFCRSDGTLGCTSCSPRRGRRELEHQNKSWYALGGELEDRILRDVRAARGGQLPEYIYKLTTGLIEADEDRWKTMKQKADDAIALASLGRRVDVGEVLRAEEDD